MASDEDNRVNIDPTMSAEQISGAKIGFAIIAVLSIFLIIGLALPVLCPQTYNDMKIISDGIMGN
jgi:hypothetical protein